MEKNQTLYSTLALAGVLPLIACALLPLAGIVSVEPVGQLDELANSYGLAIVCFLTGIHWSTNLLNSDEQPLNLMISSNVVFLFTWFMFVLASTAWSLMTQLIALIVLLLIDWRLENARIISGPYFRIRVIATVTASVALILIVLK